MMAETQREVLEFVAMRLDKDSEMIRQAIGCRTWGDALALQARWLQEMMADYATEAATMLRLSTSGAARAFDTQGHEGAGGR